jgi:hypothetical protein
VSMCVSPCYSTKYALSVVTQRIALLFRLAARCYLFRQILYKIFIDIFYSGFYYANSNLSRIAESSAVGNVV